MLNNTADVFDWADTIPGSLDQQIKSQASGRFNQVDLGGSTYYIFLNSKAKPFISQLAREAVVTGLNQNAMNRLCSRMLVPACYFLPPAIIGHPHPPRPNGTPGNGTSPRQRRSCSSQGWRARRSRSGLRRARRVSSG